MSEDTSPGERKTNVFISYSRDDSEAAGRLHVALEARGLNSYLDKHDITAGEDWKARLGGLIETADTMIFLISPDSVASPVCDWEINHAELLGKRILPVVVRDAGDGVPERLKRLNYVFMRTPDEERIGLPQLAEALAVDIGWIRVQTRYGEAATEWNKAGRPSRLLLRGLSIGEAEHWRDMRPATAPQLTETQSAFIGASRRHASNRARGWVAGSGAAAAVAVALMSYAFYQQSVAEASRAETASILAASDFRQGSELIENVNTAPDGIAFLARAARAGDPRAQTRLWTLWQQRGFWLPVGDGQSPEAAAPTSLPEAIARNFATVDFKGQAATPTQIVASADGSTVFVAIGGITDPVTLDIHVRVFKADGTPVTGWFRPPYDGETYLSEVHGVLSDQGRYLALETIGWREAANLLVYNLSQSLLAPLKSDVTANGLLPAVQGASFSVLAFHAAAGSNDSDDLLLLAGTSRGKASAFRIHYGQAYEVASAEDRSPVTLIATDDNNSWMMAGFGNRRLAIADVRTADLIGSPIRVDEPIVAVSRTGPKEIAIDQSEGKRSRFAYHAPILRLYQGDIKVGESVVAEQEPCFRAGLSESKRPVSHPSGLVLATEGNRVASVTPAGGAPVLSRRFSSTISTICASLDGRYVMISTSDQRTEVWTADFQRRLGPVIDETRVMGSEWPAPNVTDWSQISADDSVVLIRSSFWDPPNVEYFWLTVWDVATGLPLSEHQLFATDFSDGQITSGVLDPKANEVALLANGKPNGQAISLRVPEAVHTGLADFMEGVAGLRINDVGLSEPVANRAERLIAGRRLLGRTTGHSR